MKINKNFFQNWAVHNLSPNGSGFTVQLSCNEYQSISLKDAQLVANIIAAAPELLDALEEAVIGYEWKKDLWPDKWDKSDDEHLEKCLNAIKKAKGE